MKTKWLVIGLVATAGVCGAREKAPFKILYSDDFTHSYNCVSPYNPTRLGPWNIEMLRGAVRDVSKEEADVHMLQLTTMYVPWWPSKSYSMQEHYDWWRKHYGNDPETQISGEADINNYVLNGGDPVKVFVEECRKMGKAAFISCRMNDGHHREYAFNEGNKLGVHTLSKFFVENPQYILGEDPNMQYFRLALLQNWIHPEVREHKLTFIKELCEYDIDGIELDFMRHWWLFRTDQTTREERVKIMTDYIKQVRQVLDSTARPGQTRWLCVRIPMYEAYFDFLGFDLPQMAEAGVDMFNLSASYFTIQNSDMAEIRKTVPDSSVYLEVHYATCLGELVEVKTDVYKGYGSTVVRKTTPEQLRTTAHLAYAAGLDGISTFNFQYYRNFGKGDRGPYFEPPFSVLEELRYPEKLATEAQHYFWRVTPTLKFSDGSSAPGFQNKAFAPKMKAGGVAAYTLTMAPPAGGWKNAGILRILSDRELRSSEWSAFFNGVKLEPTPDVREPYPPVYPQILGAPEEYRGWIVPPELMKTGANNVEIRMVKGNEYNEPEVITFVDLFVR